MSNGRAKWYNDLALVRERLDTRSGTLERYITAMETLGLHKVLVEELKLTQRVLGECANSVNNSIQEVSNTLNEMGYELEQAKKLTSGPVSAIERATGTIMQFPNKAAVPDGWVHVVPSPALDG